MTTANRGKTAETLVKRRLEELAKASSFVWHRFADMRGGHRQVALADFMALRNGHLTLIEVKETQHEFRLPHGNVGADQIARLRMWEAAGGTGAVLVYHSTLKMWRSLKPDELVQRDGGSWDLRYRPLETLEEILL
jgi:Holliday junction resolvase